MPVSKITGFCTSDGTLFRDEQEAEKHELLLELEEWYSEYCLFSGSTRVDFEDMVSWIQANAPQIKKILEVMP